MGYLGSKAASGAYQKIISLMPVHDTYVETHLGGGAIMLRKPPAALNIGFDIDVNTIEAFCQGNPDFLDGLADDLMISASDAVTELNQLAYGELGKVLIYADPPYLAETRTSNAKYRNEYTRADHVQLLQCLRRVPANVMLSGYPSALYDEMLPDWHTTEFQVMTRGGVRTEKLWMNYDPAVVPLFSSAFAGDDYEDRRRIKRKAARWREKFRLLAPGERLAVLAALSEVDLNR
ncbi:DNA adenine methylase [Erwinia sp. JH02]|uniref:DNA adenine methylase n=1 Tax=Erwinia sp. JH02 TaxID=2733394 RepID=UPI001488FD0F|nr:DNA adenine methylase [Erwinia sp. JH02]